ncbi:hypothetical protein MSG28_010859 [Choristoneura fumiferana]|uniref:Uncharacterized protein n=1 Tax=Choristoneura fumiferana TaxID=7141 RepID=A0ACC0KNW7_CHOFU|nr:hypothetical protein MSG28_010859 [Choristoneura fumiferana]
MPRNVFLLLACIIGLSAALPSNPILRKLDDLRFQHVKDSAGNYHLVDMWMTLNDISEVARYNPTSSNVYHLFTRNNPTTSQPLLINNPGLLELTEFSNSRRTIVLLHGWRDGAFLAAENVNVIVVDWSEGSSGLYSAALENTVSSGQAVAQFINWLNEASFSSPVQYHIVGHGLGGHKAGIVARHVEGSITYVTGLDPSLVGWINHSDRFQPTDAAYTEVIHTNCGVNGYLSDLADVDFYPNGGESMPGCDSHACDHERAVHYFGESITTGGFTGRQCINYMAAILGTCNIMPLRLEMGGLRPKMGNFKGCASLMYLNGDKMSVSLSFGKKVITNRTLSSDVANDVESADYTGFSLLGEDIIGDLFGSTGEIILTNDRSYEVIKFQIPKSIWREALNPTPVLRQQATIVLPIHVAQDDENYIEDDEDDIEEPTGDNEANLVQDAPVVEPIVQSEITNAPTVANITEKPLLDEETTTLAPQNVNGSVFRFPCSCVQGQCGCCTGTIMERFKMKACGNISFVPEDFVFDVRMSVNNRTVVRRRVSASDPPPICFNPARAPFVRVCAEISNIRIRNRNAFACLDINADIAGFQIYSASFRCFGLGASGVQAGLKPKPVSSGPAPVSLFGNSGDGDDNRGGFLSNAAGAIFGGGDSESGGLFGGGGGIFGGGDDGDDGGPLDAFGDAVGDFFDGRKL